MPSDFGPERFQAHHRDELGLERDEEVDCYAPHSGK